MHIARSLVLCIDKISGSWVSRHVTQNVRQELCARYLPIAITVRSENHIVPVQLKLTGVGIIQVNPSPRLFRRFATTDLQKPLAFGLVQLTLLSNLTIAKCTARRATMLESAAKYISPCRMLARKIAKTGTDLSVSIASNS